MNFKVVYDTLKIDIFNLLNHLMKKKEINFTQYIVQINNNNLSQEQIETIFSNDGDGEKKNLFSYDNKEYEFKSHPYEENLTFIECVFGSSTPRADTIYDKVEQSTKKNPLTPFQSELRHQIFFLYDHNQHILYASSHKLNKFLQNLIQQKISSDKLINIQKKLLNHEDFSKVIKQANNIELVATKDLFSNNIYNEIRDTTGINAHGYKLSLQLSQPAPKEQIQKLLSFFTKNQDTITDLICKGQDDDDFDIYFNSKTFTKKISLKLPINQNQRLNPDKVKEELINKIQNV